MLACTRLFSNQFQHQMFDAGRRSSYLYLVLISYPGGGPKGNLEENKERYNALLYSYYQVVLRP